MIPREYTPLALRTAAGDYAAIRGRLQNLCSVDLLHAALGMSSEVSEILEVSSTFKVQYWDDKTRQDILAELGDCCWYLNLACSCISKEFGQSSFCTFPVKDDFSANAVFNQGTLSMSLSAGNVCDMVKAYIFYGKEVNRDFLNKALDAYYAGIIMCCSGMGVHLENILEKNIAKLTERYGDSFSEERALTRNLRKEEIAYSK
jgi:hypothetical protein